MGFRGDKICIFGKQTVPSLIIIKLFCLDSPNVTLVYGSGIDYANIRSVQIKDNDH